MKGLLEHPVFQGFILIVCLAAAPAVLSMYGVIILTEILIMSLFAMSFNLLFGYSGLLSFGQAGFFGAGAYCAVH